MLSGVLIKAAPVTRLFEAVSISQLRRRRHGANPGRGGDASPSSSARNAPPDAPAPFPNILLFQIQRSTGGRTARPYANAAAPPPGSERRPESAATGARVRLRVYSAARRARSLFHQQLQLRLTGAPDARSGSVDLHNGSL
ncbi:hypothetical protein SKAU_G00125360 [Synaphobranchus kaupii]|uniref:Uncharacterized protein n=1 Tax=Synaphobranchus kaupii TaxID=118154 RepID=A0A9Q1FQ04_SYNKA|nr:hypothetical protein SKAU_G00125360 [Synaphobranchus kaupii]